MAEVKSKTDKMAEVAKKIAEETEEKEIRQTLFAAGGKSTKPAKAPITSEKYRDDVLRRVNRRHTEKLQEMKAVEEQGHLLVVTMPNGFKIRLTINNDTPVPAILTRADIVRWEVV